MIDKNHKRTADYSRPNYMISLRRQTPTSGTKDQETMQPLPPLPLHPGSFRVRIRRPSNSEGKGAKITERHIDDYLHAYGEAATGLSPEVFEIYPKGVMRVALVRIVDLARTDPYFAGLAFRIRNRSVESGSIPPLRIKKGITERMANDEALESLGKTHLHTEETRKENERTPEEKQKIREQKARSAMDKISGRAPGKPPKTTKIYGDESHEDEGVIGYDAYHDSLIRELYRPIHAMLPSSDFLTEAAYFGSWGWKVLRSWKTMCSGGSWDKKQMLGHLLRCGGLMYPYEIYSLIKLKKGKDKIRMMGDKRSARNDLFSREAPLYSPICRPPEYYENIVRAYERKAELLPEKYRFCIVLPKKGAANIWYLYDPFHLEVGECTVDHLVHPSQMSPDLNGHYPGEIRLSRKPHWEDCSAFSELSLGGLLMVLGSRLADYYTDKWEGISSLTTWRYGDTLLRESIKHRGPAKMTSPGRIAFKIGGLRTAFMGAVAGTNPGLTIDPK